MALAEVDMNVMAQDEEEYIPKKKGDKRMSVERIYQKKSQLEHILLRPDSYIGSVEPSQEKMWIYEEEMDAIINKTITFTPGLYKIFDEILVNAADNKQRDPRMNTIKVTIDEEKNVISIYNNGKGIPIELHKTEKMYVPTLIFGHLLTSSNYDDTEKKVVGGRNGFGAKLCNIFSTKFTVETANDGKKFKQVWKNNMGKVEQEKISDFSGTDYTCITFSPDLPKFKMEKLDPDFVALLKRRAYDIAGVARGVKIYLNGKQLKIKNFKDYVQLHLKGATLSKKKEGDMETPEQPKIIHEIINPRWEVCITVSETGFQQCSFVNSIATTKGGTHVNYLVDQVCEKLIAAVKKKTGKGGFNIKPFQVKSHLWVFANTLIENPTFDSQTKENMTLRKSSFGSVCELTEKYIKQVQDCGVLDNIMSWVRFKSEAQLNKKTFANKHSKLKGIPKLDDANDAGTKNSRGCTLIVTEGDSAKALAMSGISVIGRDKYGVFPLRGKMLNVRDATHKQIMDNAEVGFLLKIIGLQFGKKYTEEDMKTLRYGHLMIMADQDADGSHIKGLVINFIHAHWPSLLKLEFLEEFITPIVKVIKGKEEKSFFSLPEFDEWKENTPNNKSWRCKYYKGLGTSTSKEGKEYFSAMQRHRVVFEYDGPSSDQALVMAFSKKCANERKNWLTTGMEERKLRREAGLPEVYLYEKNTKSVSYRDFINKELILFSNADNERSIPCLVDGLKPGQRKVLFTCMKRNDKNEVKVAQLAGSVAEMSAYHHGEQSLMGTIVGLAQNFIGSNNLNILLPLGQFGTRNLGGKDSASPRYIFTKMSSLTRLIFPATDDNVLNFLYEDNMKIEPEWYCPIIPMVLVNGAEGIGTGWATKVPNYDVRELIIILKAMIAGEEPPIDDIGPSFKNYKGGIEKVEFQKFATYGTISVIDETTVEISELPIKVWTQGYKESVMDVLLYGNEKQQPMITDYKEYHTDTTVRFLVTMTEEKLQKAEQEGLHKIFKLDSSFTTSSMVLFDEFGVIRKYESVYDIIKVYQKVRLQKYQERRVFLLGILEAECAKLENQARFILEKIEGKVIIENRSRRDIITTLVERGFQSDPVKAWKASVEVSIDDDDESQDGRTNAASSVASSSGGPDFQYLLTMPIMSVSREKKEELLRQRDEKKEELERLRGKSPQDLWLDELDALLEELDCVEEQERIEEEASAAIKKSGPGKSAKGRVAKPAKIVPTKTGREVKPPPKEVKTKVPKKAKSPVNKPKEEKEESVDKANGEVPSLAERLKKKAAGGTKKQSTLAFKTETKRKKFGSDSDDSDDSFNPLAEKNEEFAGAPARTMRQKTTVKKYTVDMPSDEDIDENTTDDDDDDDNADEPFMPDLNGGLESGSNTLGDDAGHLALPKNDLKAKDDDENDAEAETRALIEKLSPMKKTKTTSKPKNISKLALEKDPLSTGSIQDPISLEDSPVKVPPKKKKNVRQTAIHFGKEISDDADIFALSSADDENVEEKGKKIETKKAAPKKVTKKDTTTKDATKKPGTKKASPKKASPKKVVAKKASPKKTVPKKTSSKKTIQSSDDDSDADIGKDDDSDSDVDVKETKVAAKRAHKDSSDDDEKEPSNKKSRGKKPAQKKSPSKPAKKRKAFDDSSDEGGSDFELPVDVAPLPARERKGRAAATTTKAKPNYKFSSSEDDDDSDDFC